MEYKEKTLGLCEGRHEIPVDGYIFGNELNPLDLEDMGKQVHETLCDCHTLTLYVTGLTVALGEVVKYCYENLIDLTLMHYDRNSGEYYSQTIIRTRICPICGAVNHVNNSYCSNCGAS